MVWAQTTRHQASVQFKGQMFNIICDEDEYGDIALSINGEFICDVEELPTYEELQGYIDDYTTVESMARQSFLKRSI